MTRCVCGHSWDIHQHLRLGDDCGSCGRWRCGHYVALDRRDTAVLTPGQEIALAQSDAHMWANFSVLRQFALDAPPLPIPGQRAPSEPTAPPGLRPRQSMGSAYREALTGKPPRDRKR